jgi:hypothetical protein
MATSNGDFSPMSWRVLIEPWYASRFGWVTGPQVLPLVAEPDRGLFMQHVRCAATENRWVQHNPYYEMSSPDMCNWGSVEGLDYRNQTRMTLPNIARPRNYRRRKPCVVMLFQRATRTLVTRQTVRSQPINPLGERSYASVSRTFFAATATSAPTIARKMSFFIPSL